MDTTWSKIIILMIVSGQRFFDENKVGIVEFHGSNDIKLLLCLRLQSPYIYTQIQKSVI